MGVHAQNAAPETSSFFRVFSSWRYSGILAENWKISNFSSFSGGGGISNDRVRVPHSGYLYLSRGGPSRQSSKKKTYMSFFGYMLGNGWV